MQTHLKSSVHVAVIARGDSTGGGGGAADVGVAGDTTVASARVDRVGATVAVIATIAVIDVVAVVAAVANTTESGTTKMTILLIPRAYERQQDSEMG